MFQAISAEDKAAMIDSRLKRRLSNSDNLPPRCQLALWLFLLLFVSYGYFFQAGQDNGNARFAQLRTILEDGSLAINAYAYTSADVVFHDGSYYPNKAPGTTLLALPLWAALSPALDLLVEDAPLREHLLCYLTTVFLIGGATAITGVLLYHVSLLISTSSATALLLAVGYALGSLAFPFATLFFSHQLAAALLFGSFYLVLIHHTAAPLRLQLASSIVAGLLLGLAVTTEYPAALAALPLGCYALWRLRQWRLVLLFGAGAVSGIAPIFIYQWAAFGSPWFIPYSAYAQSENAAFPAHQMGFMGVTAPSLNVLYELTFGQMRGLFVFNPWLVLVVAAAPSLLLWNKPFQAERLVAAAIVILFFAFNAGYGDSYVYWGGGASAGPRHLIPMLPFATLLIAYASRLPAVRYLAALLIPPSIAIMLMVTAVEPRAPYESSMPLTSFYLDNFLRGIYALDATGTFSNRLVTADSVSFNWGKLAALPGWLQLAPLLLLWGLIALRISKLSGAVGSRISSGAFYVYASMWLVMYITVPGVSLAWDTLRYSGPHGLFVTFYKEIPWSESHPSKLYAPTPALPEQLHRRAVEKTAAITWMSLPLPEYDTFAAEWNGYIRIPHSGRYGFATISDDGSALYIDGKLVVDNWGQHSAERREEWIELQAGFYPFAVRYYNKGFGSGLDIMWAWMDKPMQPIPPRYLYLLPER